MGSEGSTAGRDRPRDWLANLKAHPEFVFLLKESVQEGLPAVATEVTDRAERTRVLSGPEARWYREAIGSLDRMVDDAPLVRVTFTGEAAALNVRSS